MAIIWFRNSWLNRIIAGFPGDCAGCALRILNKARPGPVMARQRSSLDDGQVNITAFCPGCWFKLQAQFFQQ